MAHNTERSQKVNRPAWNDKSVRFICSIKNPALHGLPPGGYDSHLLAADKWPPETEYVHSYCSNYKLPPQPQHQQQQRQRFECLQHVMREDFRQCEKHCHSSQLQEPERQTQCCICHRQDKDSDPCPQTRQPRGESMAQHNFSLYDTTPAALLDKHYRGAHYVPGHPLGVQVPEERFTMKQTTEGSVRMEEHVANSYLPLYKYKDWVERPEIEVWRNCNSNGVICVLPSAPTEHWDFYNQVRMQRPAKSVTSAKYALCRLLPIPRDLDLPNEAVREPYPCEYGRFRDNRFANSTFPTSNLCWC
ncbi:hypothetical protein PoB_002751800 [Plakobranchus ocellatus]|uniref:Uncharacterized protein n=1 Tax=Plakobranchus ocellatus TaxID=259542 RepID=A0AAV4A1J1_9GAST|nr:hypothetical protein PoB_002751800 [Plakobranchus ocellatus]